MHLGPVCLRKEILKSLMGNLLDSDVCFYSEEGLGRVMDPSCRMLHKTILVYIFRRKGSEVAEKNLVWAYLPNWACFEDSLKMVFQIGPITCIC